MRWWVSGRATPFGPSTDAAGPSTLQLAILAIECMGLERFDAVERKAAFEKAAEVARGEFQICSMPRTTRPTSFHLMDEGDWVGHREPTLELLSRYHNSLNGSSLPIDLCSIRDEGCHPTKGTMRVATARGEPHHPKNR